MAFEKLGTQSAVAAFFNVSRPTLLKWAKMHDYAVRSRPYSLRAKTMAVGLSLKEQRVRIAQWIIDEGSVSSRYSSSNDSTVLVVAGNMTDPDALRLIGKIANARVNNARFVKVLGWMPMSYVRIDGANAYALLQIIREKLAGLKRREADAALEFFPPTGRVKGRLTTDAFLLAAWKSHAKSNFAEWNSNRDVPLSDAEVDELSDSWIASRIRRARYFIRRTDEARVLRT